MWVKKKILAIGFCILFTGCESKAGTGALAGAGVGALAGGLIGGNAAGVLIGGAVGAATGAVIGAALDSEDRDKLERNSPGTLQKIDGRQQLSLHDIEEMAKNGIQDDVIIAQIQNTNSVFYLTSEEIVELKQSGVSDKVLEFMIKTGGNRSD